MSTRIIAVESNVYARLAREERGSESFTKVIARLLNVAAETHTGSSIATALNKSESLPDCVAEQMLAVVRKNRTQEKWERHDLRRYHVS